MTNPDDERIRQRAHQLWEAEGCPEGREHDHWEQASSEIMAQSGDGTSDDDTSSPQPMGDDLPVAPSKTRKPRMTADQA